MPQLTGYVPCPRHRLALYDSKNDKLMPVLTNMNMLNLSLRWWGPTNEGTLCLKLLSFQAVFSLVPLMHLFCFGGAN